MMGAIACPSFEGDGTSSWRSISHSRCPADDTQDVDSTWFIEYPDAPTLARALPRAGVHGPVLF